ncbi:MAG: patatin-like phospholipase family protein, partial [Pseudomonadota bacterium]
LVGGTSTGAIVATSISLGLPLARVKTFYVERAAQFFKKRRWLSRFAQRAAFDIDALEREVTEVIGDVKLGDDAFKTYLAIVTKRLDTGSAWILSNLPQAPYFEDPEDGSYHGNRHYTVARLLAASAAAPTYFDQRYIQIAPDQIGVFVDGGLSPYNDPSLALLKIARLSAFGLQWPANDRDLFILSIGTGRYRPRLDQKTAMRLAPIPLAYHAMRGMVTDAEVQTLTMMQWLGTSKQATPINSEIGALEDDHLTVQPAFSFLKLDLPLEQADLVSLGIDVPSAELERYYNFDDPEIIEPIYELAQRYIEAALDFDELLKES